mgnify:FL=1
MASQKPDWMAQHRMLRKRRQVTTRLLLLALLAGCIAAL